MTTNINSAQTDMKPTDDEPLPGTAPITREERLRSASAIRHLSNESILALLDGYEYAKRECDRLLATIATLEGKVEQLNQRTVNAGSRCDEMREERDAAIARAEAAERERDTANDDRERVWRQLIDAKDTLVHSQQFNAVRFERLRDLCEKHGLLDEYCQISANGQLYREPPTYAQLLNGTQHKLEAMEKRFDAARAEVDRVKKAGAIAREHILNAHGENNVIKYKAATINRWHEDPNLDIIKETSRIIVGAEGIHGFLVSAVAALNPSAGDSGDSGEIMEFLSTKGSAQGAMIWTPAPDGSNGDSGEEGENAL